MGIEMLPASLIEAQAELEKDTVISKAMGTHIMDGLTSIATVESDLFRLAVHPWELERYLATY